MTLRRRRALPEALDRWEDGDGVEGTVGSKVDCCWRCREKVVNAGVSWTS